MTDRTTLALAACQGMSDEELKTRGAGSFLKTIKRKREYSAQVKAMGAAGKLLVAEHKAMAAQVKLLKSQIATLQAIEAPITDTSEAGAMLAAIAAKK